MCTSGERTKTSLPLGGDLIAMLDVNIALEFLAECWETVEIPLRDQRPGSLFVAEFEGIMKQG
jgi:hypothetical protein